jgi:hypothetical protein
MSDEDANSLLRTTNQISNNFVIGLDRIRQQPTRGGFSSKRNAALWALAKYAALVYIVQTKMDNLRIRY